VITILSLSQRQVVQKKAAVQPASLSLLPETAKFPLGQSQTAQIMLNTGERAVVGVDASLTFDPSMIKIESVQPGSLFQGQIVFKNEVANNKILLSLGSFTPFNGSGVYGTLKFAPLKAGTASLNFNPYPESKIAPQGGGNILEAVKNGAYSFTNSLKFSLKFQNVTGNRGEKMIKTKFGDIFNGQIAVKADANGLYQGRIENLTAGSSYLKLKGPAHLTKKISPVVIPDNQEAVLDLTSSPLLGGEATGDDRVDSEDFARLQADYLASALTRNADFNFDNRVDSEDFAILQMNYLKVGEQ